MLGRGEQNRQPLNPVHPGDWEKDPWSFSVAALCQHRGCCVLPASPVQELLLGPVLNVSFVSRQTGVREY